MSMPVIDIFLFARESTSLKDFSTNCYHVTVISQRLSFKICQLFICQWRPLLCY